MNTLQSINARTGEAHGTPLTPSTAQDIDRAATAAHAAFDAWGRSSGEQRAALLRALADGLEAERETLVPLADLETALGPVRLNGELDRTTFQLRRFADIALRGEPFAVLDDPAVAGGPPAGHPAMVRQRVPLGPVAMFAASNFPFAFSVLGGDTASALAAGCPVVVKAHPGHPGLSQAVFAMIQRVLQAQGLPAGLIGFVQGAAVAQDVEGGDVEPLERLVIKDIKPSSGGIKKDGTPTDYRMFFASALRTDAMKPFQDSEEKSGEPLHLECMGMVWVIAFHEYDRRIWNKFF